MEENSLDPKGKKIIEDLVAKKSFKGEVEDFAEQGDTALETTMSRNKVVDGSVTTIESLSKESPLEKLRRLKEELENLENSKNLEKNPGNVADYGEETILTKRVSQDGLKRKENLIKEKIEEISKLIASN